ncbi:uncharacterized protein isoform X2 [Rhodnius prolixus]|uniref:uncharacterized protein isoform X2 n=1 Tax=Rhodnius prolixus TaxID=13249 RepID=UPI003D188AC9
MDIPLPEDPPLEESKLNDIPVPEDANTDTNRYSPSLPIEDDPPELKETEEVTFPDQPTSSIVGQNVYVPTLLGKSAAKKRLLAFTLAKQNLPIIKKIKNEKTLEDAPVRNITKENDQINLRKKRKKDKARDTISEIEEIKRKENVVRESMQVLYPRWVNRDGSGTATTHLSLPDIEEDDSYKIENLVEKLLAKKAKRERSEKEKEAEKRERRERREKEKVVPKSWEEFNKAGFIAYHYRRLKYRREKLPRATKCRHNR